MFKTGIFIGIFSYTVFFAGLLGFISTTNVIYLIFLYFFIFLFLIRKSIVNFFISIRKAGKSIDKLYALLLILIFFQVAINLIGALGPELAFDALWYHLTIPKIWLENMRIFYIPGGLLYYSAMPKLAEMLYIAGLAIGDETTVKLIHFVFGILTLFTIYKLTSKIFNKITAIAASAIFYANPVIAWESITAYIDLTRAFYEILSLWAFILWTERHKNKWLILSGIFLGLAITTKLLATGSIIIFIVLIIVNILTQRKSGNIYERFLKNFNLILRSLFIFIFSAILIPFPWLMFAYVNTGNAFYPFFSNLYPVNPTSINIVNFFSDIYNLFLYSADPLSPVYLAFLPLIVLYFKAFDHKAKLVLIYSVLAIVVWYFTPQSGGGRFIAAYLPAISIATGGIIFAINTKKQFNNNYAMKIIIFGTIITASLICIVYRGGANLKYLPVIFGSQSKSDFLENNLVFTFGDFYDIDGYFARTIKNQDKVLLIGFHNLYYIDFPYVHESWLNQYHKFNYIATQNSELPYNYGSFKLVYANAKTGVKLYKN